MTSNETMISLPDAKRKRKDDSSVNADIASRSPTYSGSAEISASDASTLSVDNLNIPGTESSAAYRAGHSVSFSASAFVPLSSHSSRNINTSAATQIASASSTDPCTEEATFETACLSAACARNGMLNELRRREVIARLGLHSYLSSGALVQPALPASPSPPRPPTNLDTPALLLLRNLVTESQNQQQQQQQSNILLALLQQAAQQQQQEQQQRRQEQNDALMLQNAVVSLLQARLINSVAAQSFQNLSTNGPGIEPSAQTLISQQHGSSSHQGEINAATMLVAVATMEGRLQATLQASPTTSSSAAAETSSIGSNLAHREEGASRKRHSPVPMVSDDDVKTLSEYQGLLREQMDLFEASTEDVKVTAQGRNKPIFMRQVGIQCKHCAHLPPNQRPRGAVYFPTRLSSIYQSAQNMGQNHFTGNHCPNLPESISIDLEKHKNKKSLLHGGGKNYWAGKAVEAGLVEVENGLVFGNHQ